MGLFWHFFPFFATQAVRGNSWAGVEPTLPSSSQSHSGETAGASPGSHRDSGHSSRNGKPTKCHPPVSEGRKWRYPTMTTTASAHERAAHAEESPEQPQPTTLPWASEAHDSLRRPTCSAATGTSEAGSRGRGGGGSREPLEVMTVSCRPCGPVRGGVSIGLTQARGGWELQLHHSHGNERSAPSLGLHRRNTGAPPPSQARLDAASSRIPVGFASAAPRRALPDDALKSECIYLGVPAAREGTCGTRLLSSIWGAEDPALGSGGSVPTAARV